MVPVVFESSIVLTLKQLLLDRCERDWGEECHRPELDSTRLHHWLCGNFYIFYEFYSFYRFPDRRGGHWSLWGVGFFFYTGLIHFSSSDQLAGKIGEITSALCLKFSLVQSLAGLLRSQCHGDTQTRRILFFLSTFQNSCYEMSFAFVLCTLRLCFGGFLGASVPFLR